MTISRRTIGLTNLFVSMLAYLVLSTAVWMTEGNLTVEGILIGTAGMLFLFCSGLSEPTLTDQTSSSAE